MTFTRTSFICALILVGCAGAQPEPNLGASSAPSAAPAAATEASTTPVRAPAQTVVAAADRSDADRALDAGRRPAELLAFTGVAPGMRVADLAAGRGYTAELLARAVGETGAVYGQNTKFILGFAEQEWSARLALPVMKNVVRVDTEFDEPLPPNVKELDLVTLVLFYHDTVWLKTDRPRMNKNIFGALKSGGSFVVVDHSSKPGEGLTVVQTLHRIEESVVKAEVEAAGFVLDAEADFLRDPSDTRDWSASPRTAGERRGHSDRFALRFKKP
ncbi:MAG TPA: SAM-dependent methyltransferase [Polyangiaceae bacterium]|nr:SAM-dependent methyltransferase [Polyangiaceae bacterium]